MNMSSPKPPVPAPRKTLMQQQQKRQQQQSQDLQLQQQEQQQQQQQPQQQQQQKQQQPIATGFSNLDSTISTADEESYIGLTAIQIAKKKLESQGLDTRPAGKSGSGSKSVQGKEPPTLLPPVKTASEVKEPPSDQVGTLGDETDSALNRRDAIDFLCMQEALKARKLKQDHQIPVSSRRQTVPEGYRLSSQVIYRALYDYSPCNSDELQLTKNGQYVVVDTYEPGWFKGHTLDGVKAGVFPVNFMQHVQEEPVALLPEMTYQFTNDADAQRLKATLKALGLIPFYPGKMELDDVRLNYVQKVKKMKDIPWLLIQKILGLELDHRSLADNFSVPQGTSTVKDFNPPNSDDVPSMDVFAAVFLCASPFLQAILAEKLFLCQLSIPLFLPDPNAKTLTMLLGVLRNVMCTDKYGKEGSITDHSCRIVSLVGFGKGMEDILNGTVQLAARNDHKVFHSSVSCDEEESHFWDGMVDMAWFLPKEEHVQDDITIFINLRGDVNNYPKQFEILKKLSTLVITVIGGKLMSEMIDKHSDDDAFLDRFKSLDSYSGLLVYDKRKKYLGKSNEKVAKVRKIWTDERRLFELVQHEKGATEKILEMTRCVKDRKTLSEFSRHVKAESTMNHPGQLTVTVDEHSPVPAQGLHHATMLTEFLSINGVADMKKAKAETVPIQILWKEWVKLNKKRYRNVGEEDVADEEKMGEIQREQQRRCEAMSPLMKRFILHILDCSIEDGTSKRTVLHMLNYFKHSLDDQCRSCLPQLRQKYKRSWYKLQGLQRQKSIDLQQHRQSWTPASAAPLSLSSTAATAGEGEDNRASGSIQKLENECTDMETEILDTSMGLEHVLREVGMIYEVTCLVELTAAPPVDIQGLPDAMAELLLSGQALELLDGDASNVPLNWVSAVLKCVERKIGKDKKVFVLSILGVQSSGKSTLLNTMFGLHFPVSAGRCTKGVYGQLIPACKKITPNVDYIFVIDTEGLKAPEFRGSDSYLRDREIATYVVGLGDLTIINVKGELPSEMEEILQIVIHAFLRISMATGKLMTGSCVFAHQNVSDPRAHDLTFASRQSLMQMLDRVTTLAAEAEGFPDVTKFNEVIHFDVRSHVLYFADLWSGSPPMASVNPVYSRDVHRLKNLIFERMNVGAAKSLPVISEKLILLWDSIMKENFVFSFKNSLEIRVYRKVELYQNDTKGKLTDKVMQMTNKAKNGIKSCDIKDITLVYQAKTSEINKELDVMMERGKAGLEEFFSKCESEEREAMKKWRERSEIMYESAVDDMRLKVQQDLRNIVALRQDDDNFVTKHEGTILERAKHLAKELQKEERQLGEDELRHRFDQLWHSMTEKVESSVKLRPVSVFSEVRALLTDNFFPFNHSMMNLELLNMQQEFLEFETKLIQKEVMPRDKWLTMKKSFGHTSLVKLAQCVDVIEKEMNKLFNNVTKKVAKIASVIAPFEINKVRQLLKRFQERLGKMGKTSKFALQKPFEIQMVVYVASYLVRQFQGMHERYLHQNSTQRRLRTTYYQSTWELFKQIFSKSEDDVSTAHIFCQSLKPKIKEVISEEMPRLLMWHIRTTCSCFRSKRNLERRILTELLTNHEFAELFNYIHRVEYTYRALIKRIVDKELDASYLARIKTSQIELVMGQLRSTVQEAVSRPTCVNMSTFIDEIHRRIGGILPVPQSTFAAIREMKVSDFVRFALALEEGLSRLKAELREEATVDKADAERSGKGSVYDLLYEQCAGCCEQCPFCKARCFMTEREHAGVPHRCTQHLCMGLAGKFSFSYTVTHKDQKKLVIDNCNTRVASKKEFRDTKMKKDLPYKKYREVYPEWDIPPDNSTQTSLYWKYVLATFSKEFAEAFEAKEPDIPKSWRNITKAEAIRSLECL